MDIEGYPVDGRDAIELFGQVSDFYDGMGHDVFSKEVTERLSLPAEYLGVLAGVVRENFLPVALFPGGLPKTFIDSLGQLDAVDPRRGDLDIHLGHGQIEFVVEHRLGIHPKILKRLTNHPRIHAEPSRHIMDVRGPVGLVGPDSQVVGAKQLEGIDSGFLTLRPYSGPRGFTRTPPVR